MYIKLGIHLRKKSLASRVFLTIELFKNIVQVYDFIASLMIKIIKSRHIFKVFKVNRIEGILKGIKTYF